DYCIRDEKDFWVHFNYIHYNAVKHQYANSMKEYKFSSYNNWVDKKGENWVLSCFEKYPIIEFQVDGDDF
ncbi:MAG: hypothetical protein ACE5HI_18270, partial [bacterium]